jgi:cytochrome subunit of sulfide dehydrogenase
MRTQLLISAVAVVVLASVGAAAALRADTGASANSSANAGRDIAANCANCHRTDGHGRNAIPVIVGRDKAYLVKQLRDFRDGNRPSTIMQQLITGYTDTQIEAAAAFLSQQKPN